MYDIIVKQELTEKQILLMENGNLVESYQLKEEGIEGNIYLGKVQNVLQGMQAAFVNIGENKNTFIHLNDILPKKDTKNPENIQKTDNIKELIKPGDTILVQVKRAEYNQKGARVSKHISLPGKYVVLLPETRSNYYITENRRFTRKKKIVRYCKIIFTK